jgi:very-short-patch-repair endonuclease
MRRPHVPTELTAGPFTLEQAVAAGLTRDALGSSPWRHVFMWVWVHEDVPDSREFRLACAELVLTDGAVLCLLTAAWLHGGDVRREGDLDVHVSFPKGRRLRRRPGWVVSQETLAPTDIVQVGRLRVTTPLRTAFDCLRLERGSNGIVVADALAHAGLFSLDELTAYFSSQHRLRNLRIGEALLDQVEPLSESPMETRMRVELVRSGLPRPIAQFEVKDARGVLAGRVDLAYPEHKLAVEYDGAWHWEQRMEDERRRARIRALGWEVLVYSADAVYGDPIGMAAEVRSALRARAAA